VAKGQTYPTAASRWFFTLRCITTMPGCPDARMPGCPDARMPGCPDARMPGCPDARMLGCSDARMLGCSGARGRSGVSPKVSGVGKSGAVIADLTQDPGTAQRSNAGKTGEDSGGAAQPVQPIPQPAAPLLGYRPNIRSGSGLPRPDDRRSGPNFESPGSRVACLRQSGV
jgi:hypothetical protein